MKTNRAWKRWVVSGLFALGAACAATAGEKILYESQSPYNAIFVTENDQGLRTLRFERGGALQSVVKPGDPDHLELRYARAAMSCLAFCGEPERMLVVGLGGGTIPAFLRKHFPRATIDAVDIDPEVVRVARQFFGFREDDRMRAHVADGRAFIETCREPYDIIILDAFGTDNVPFSLATVEFIRSVKSALSPRGVAVWNVWSGAANPLYDAMVRTYQEVFADLYMFTVTGTSNRILVGLAGADRPDCAELAQRAKRLSLEKGFRFDLEELVSSGCQIVREKNPAARVLTDKDRPDGM